MIRNTTPFHHRRSERLLSFIFLLCSLFSVSARATLTGLPSGFLDEVAVGELPFPTAVAFMPNTNGKMLVALKDGRVLAYNGSTPAGTFADLRSIVHDNWDRGLLGLAVHPEFPAKPYVYLLYSHDPEGVYPDDVNPNHNGPKSTSSRVSQLMRVTADAGTGYTRALAGSEVILLGKNSTRANIGAENDGENTSIAGCMNPKTPTGTPVEDCIPGDALGHSIGTVTFGRSIGADGSPQPWSLYVGMGDASSFNFADPRALRALNLDSLVGKILRINPDTGAGLPDNPFYNPAKPDSNRSKVYSYGLRNPFRFSVNPASGEPFIGDVGWNWVEEINTGKGANFGWPCYEGGVADGREESGNTSSNIQPAYASSTATKPTCDALYAAGGGAVRAPVFAYVHSVNGQHYGASVTGGSFYAGTTYPAEYRGALFIADYNRLWLRYLTFDTSGKATAHDFGVAQSGSGPVQILEGPDTNLYWLQYGDTGGTLWRIRYAGASNTPPTALIKATPLAGVAPLAVTFDGNASFDPDGQALRYEWTIDDGSGPVAFSTRSTAGVDDLAELYPSGLLPTGVYTVALTVTDPAGATGNASVIINSGANPPEVAIDQPAEGATFKVGDTIKVHGCATLGGRPVWDVRLHHNQHVHYSSLPSVADPTRADCSQTSLKALQHGDDIHYELCATITSGAGSNQITDTQCRMIQPQRPEPGYTLGSQPDGMLIQYENEGVTVPGPSLIHPIVNSKLTVSVEDIQQHRTFTGWTDSRGGVLSRNPSYTFVTAATPKTFIAAYQNFNPKAVITTLDPRTGPAPLTVRFDGAKSSDPEGDVLSYAWDAGTAGTSDLAAPDFSFPAAGSYTVKLTVTDQLGASVTQSVGISVGNPSGNKAPAVKLTTPANGSRYTAPGPVLLAAQASDADGTVTQVEFYADSTLLGTDDDEPYEFTWTDVPPGRYALRARAIDDRGGSSTSATAQITLTGTPASTNLALNRPAAASSTEGPGHDAGSAFDGNPGTRWSSEFADPQWVQVDLGTEATITGLRLVWEDAYSAAYTIQVSRDGASWTDVYQTDQGAGGTEMLSVNGIGRYVRMYGQRRGTDWGHSLWEMEVYGTGGRTGRPGSRQ